MNRTLPIPSPMPRKRELSGAALAAFEDTISFGKSRAIDTMETLHALAVARGENDVMAKDVTAGDLAWAIDHVAPVVEGQRTLSQSFDADSVVSQASQGNTPTMILARLELDAWLKDPRDEMVGGLQAADVYHTIKYLDYVARYKPVEPEAPEHEMMSL
jgi:hypothetical protein